MIGSLRAGLAIGTVCLALVAVAPDARAQDAAACHQDPSPACAVELGREAFGRVAFDPEHPHDWLLAAIDLAGAEVAMGNRGDAYATLGAATNNIYGIEDAPGREGELIYLAEGLAGIGLFEEAADVAASIGADGYRYSAKVGIVRAYAAAGMYRDAAIFIRTIPDPPSQRDAWRAMVFAFAEAGLDDEAVTAAMQIDNPFARVEALRGAGVAFEGTEVVDDPQAMIDETLAEIGAGGPGPFAVYDLVDTALVMAALGMTAQADEVLAHAAEQAAGADHATAHANTHLRIALAHAALGQMDRAQAVADLIQISNYRSGAYRDIALAYANADMAAEAAAAFDAALDAIGLEAEPVRSGGQLWIVQAMVAAGDLDRARAVAEGIERPEDRAYAQRDVAEALAVDGRFADALDIAAAITDPLFATRAYAATALAMTEAANGG